MLNDQEQIQYQLAFVISRLSEAGREALLSFVLSGFSDEAALRDAESCVEELDRYDAGAMAEWILGTVETETNGLTFSAVKEWLRELRRRDRCLGLCDNEFITPVINLTECQYPLHLAAESGVLDYVKQLIGKGTPPDCMNAKGQTPLHCAALAGRFDIVQWLIDEGGATPDIGCYDEGATPLHYASSGGHLRIVQWLLDVIGVDPSIKDKQGQSPLHCAATSGNLDLVRWLVDEKGLAPAIKDGEGRTPLHTAAFHGHLSVVQWLVDKKGISSRIEDGKGATPVHYAAESDALDVVKWLIEKKGVAPEIKDDAGRTTLYYARKDMEPTSTLYYLIGKKRAPLDRKDEDYATVIRYAAEAGNLEIIKWLAGKQSPDTL